MSKSKGDLSKSTDENKVVSRSADHPHPRREKWIKDVQRNKENNAKRATIDELPTSQTLKETNNNVKLQSAKKAPQKRSSFFEKRRSAPAAIGKTTSRRESIERFNSLTSGISSDSQLFGSIDRKTNREKVVKEIEQELHTKMTELSQALVTLISEFGDIKSIEKKMARAWVITDKLKDRQNEMREICSLQRKLDKQIKTVLKQMENVPSLVDDAISAAKKPYLTKHPEIVAAIKEELTIKAKQQGRELSLEIFDNLETDESFFKMLDDLVDNFEASIPLAEGENKNQSKK